MIWSRAYFTAVTLAGIAGVAVLGVLPRQGPGPWFALTAAMLLQVPLGWWALRSLGSDRFALVWGAGLLARFGLLAIAALVVIPALTWPIGPTLLTLAAGLFGLLLVEGFVALLASTKRMV